MTRCAKCGEELPEDAEFCPNCGTAIKTLEKLPRHVELSLTRGEKVLKSFKLKFKSEVYLTNKKMLVKKGESTQSINYKDISSIHYKKAPSWATLIGCALCVAVGMIERSTLSYLFYFLAGLLFLAYFGIEAGLIKRLEITVVGLKKPIKIEGEKKMLESILKIIEGKRTE